MHHTLETGKLHAGMPKDCWPPVSSGKKAKMRRTRQLATFRDFLLITETHGNEGKCVARKLPKGITPCWPNGEGGEAGVGIWAQASFLTESLANRDATNGSVWYRVVPLS